MQYDHVARAARIDLVVILELTAETGDYHVVAGGELADVDLGLEPYVQDALDDLQRKQKLRLAETPAYGCSVKYAD